MKFQSLKLKGVEEKRRGGFGTPHGPSAFDALGSALATIAEGSTNGGARGCSLKSYVTSVTGVTSKNKYMILKVYLVVTLF